MPMVRRMSRLFNKLDRKRGKDIRILADFISIYCRENHRMVKKDIFPIVDSRLDGYLGNKELELCPDCQKLLNHGIAKLLQCPYDPKPMCKKCQTHCYAPAYRERIREVMKFSGLYLVKHGRIDLIMHYYL